MSAVAAALSAAVLGCTMKNQEAPPLTGPSEFATSITVQITPDTITQDGASQALVTITAHDASGAPLRNVTLRVETFVNGVRQDVGTLSARTVVTGSDGKATLTFTAPAGAVNGTESQVDIAVTPLGGNFNNAVTQSARVRLVPQGVVFPPVGLTPRITVSPAAPTEDTSVLFDASTSEGAVSFTWTIEGRTLTGQQVTHTFANPGDHFVTLTIADAFGRTASTTSTVRVARATLPTASYDISPSNPRVGDTVNFNALGSTAGDGRRIVSYTWDFGDGTVVNAGPLVAHTYTTARNYVTSLTVTDDAGNTDSQNNSLTVSAATASAAAAASAARGATPVVNRRR